MTHTSRPRPFRSAALAVALGGLLLFSGCYVKDEQGGVSTYSVPLWAPAVAAAGGVAAVFLGRLSYRRWSKQLGFALMLTGPVFAVVVAPMLAVNTVVVDGEHFEVVDGFFWDVERHSVSFADVAAASLDVRMVQTRRGQTEKRTLLLTMKDGSRQSIVVKNALREAWPDVAARLKNRNSDF